MNTTLTDIYATGAVIRLTKMAVVVAEGTLYQPDYWLEGVLRHQLCIGSPIFVDRFRRSRREGDPEGSPAAIKCPGLFTSSAIQAIDKQVNGWLIYTVNSVWHIDIVAPTPVSY